MSTQELDPRFKIRAPLRCQGVGRLDCAEDVESGVRMAIRWIPLVANGAAAARATEELPLHPALPRIRQTGSVGASAYVALEFPEGRLLSTLLGETFGAEALMRLGAAMADALALLHANGIIHGELSPGSVLLLPEDRALLWDMPLVLTSRLTDRRGEERTLAQLTQTAAFLAPERARGLPASASSDVYGLAAVLALAAGAAPPPGATTLAVVNQVANRKWTPEVPLALPRRLRRLLGRMLSADPLARPQAKEVAELLSKPLDAWPAAPADDFGDELGDGTAGVMPKWRALLPRARWWVAGGAAAGVLLFSFLQGTGPKERAPGGRRELKHDDAVVTPSNERPAAAPALVDSTSASPKVSEDLEPLAPPRSPDAHPDTTREDVAALLATELGRAPAAKHTPPAAPTVPASKAARPSEAATKVPVVSLESTPPPPKPSAPSRSGSVVEPAVGVLPVDNGVVRPATARAHSAQAVKSAGGRSAGSGAAPREPAAVSPSTSPEPSSDRDFSFLPSAVEAPKSELKTPR